MIIADRDIQARLLTFRCISTLLRPLVALARVSMNLCRKLSYGAAMALYFDARDTDVFIVTYPKSGTTLMQMLLYHLLKEGTMDFGHIDLVAPELDSALAKGPQYLSNMTSPRIFKTHRNIAELPTKGRCIYVVRNAKDTCVSYFYHLTSLQGLRKTKEEFVTAFIRGRVPWGSWYKHLDVCLRHFNKERMLLLRYEDVVSDLPTAIDKISRFCGATPSDDLVTNIKTRCNISFMKAHVALFDPRLTPGQNNTQFIRSGLTGDWVSELPPHLSEAIDRGLTRVDEQNLSAFGLADLVRR